MFFVVHDVIGTCYISFLVERAGSCFGRHAQDPAPVSTPSWNVLLFS